MQTRHESKALEEAAGRTYPSSPTAHRAIKHCKGPSHLHTNCTRRRPKIGE